MNKDDLVRISAQPANQWLPLVGKVGIVEEVCGDAVQFVAISKDGEATGMGTVPASSLTAEEDPDWQKAARSYFERMEALRKIGEDRIRRYKEHVEKVAAMFEVSVETVEGILREMSDLSLD